MIPLQELIFSTKPDYIAGIESRGFIFASALLASLLVKLIEYRSKLEI